MARNQFDVQAKREKWRQYNHSRLERSPKYFDKYKGKYIHQHPGYWTNLYRNNPRRRRLVLFYEAQRRALQAGLSGTHTLEQWLARVDFYGWRCAYCSTSLDFATLTQDHVIPVSRGGTNWASNLRPACKSCNSKKKNRSPKEFFVGSKVTYCRIHTRTPAHKREDVIAPTSLVSVAYDSKMARIGSLGGSKVLADKGTEHFSRISRLRKSCRGGRPRNSKK